MPSVDEDQRKDLLKTAPGATQYIGAILDAVAGISGRYGLDIRNDPGVLTTIYHGWKPSNWKDHMKEKAASHPKGQPWPRPVVANPMGIWVAEHIPYLEEAVGFSPVEQQAIGEKPTGATGEGKTAPAP